MIVLQTMSTGNPQNGITFHFIFPKNPFDESLRLTRAYDQTLLMREAPEGVQQPLCKSLALGLMCVCSSGLPAYAP